MVEARKRKLLTSSGNVATELPPFCSMVRDTVLLCVQPTASSTWDVQCVSVIMPIYGQVTTSGKNALYHRYHHVNNQWLTTPEMKRKSEERVRSTAMLKIHDGDNPWKAWCGYSFIMAESVYGKYVPASLLGGAAIIERFQSLHEWQKYIAVEVKIIELKE